MFAGISFLMSSIFFFFVSLFQKNLHQLNNLPKNIYRDLVMITIFIVIIPYVLFFIGTGKTSGLNSALLQLSELIFALVLSYFIGERNDVFKYLGAGGILIGSIILMYHGSFKLNIGDVLLFLGAASFPVGNFYAKKALNILSPAVILFIRYLFGGFFILLMSLIFENYSDFNKIFFSYWEFFVLYGLVVMTLSTFLWYQSLKRLDISKATSLNMLFPFFSVLILIALGEKITSLQFIGIVIIFLGAYFAIKRPSTDPKLTKYAEA